MQKEAEKLFIEQVDLAFKTQKNKRRGHDSLVYEHKFVSETVKGLRARMDLTLRIKHNYAFLTSTPRWREIMATEFEGRKIDHEICDLVIPLADKLLSPYTFNNREGKGSMAAINCLIEHVAEASEGYTKPCRVIKLDFKGYFPNALWDFAEKMINEVIDTGNFDDEYRSYLKWLTMIAIHCNPVRCCELRTPRFMWREHIDDEKSLFEKEEGVGAAIGRLVWQTAMGLYINDIIKWLTDECGIRVVCFVDDIILIVPERLHQYTLSLLPILRSKLLERNIKLNEKKFYDQPYWRGLEFLGSHIKPYRIHLNNSTYSRAINKVKELNASKYKDIDEMVSSLNSYLGILKNRTDYKRIRELISLVDEEWWKWLNWNPRRLCVTYRKGYSINERLNKKYNLKLKKYDTSRSKRRSKHSVH